MTLSHSLVRFSILLACLQPMAPWLQPAAAAQPPNVLFIAMDDLNDWTGYLGGHPQVRTPNLDRLAAASVAFHNAHCAAPACNPSRTAIMTGISPHVSGLYDNGQKMREILPEVELLPAYFRRHGYRATGSGKMLHYFIDARSWDDYFPAKESENPLPRTLYPDPRPLSLPVGGPWQYVETDWGPLHANESEYGGDWLVADEVCRQLSEPKDRPFFLACGIYRPHEPWFVPAKHFEPFPLENIQLPPGYREDDLEDLPPEGQRRGPNRYFAHIQKQGQWKRGIQGYLASIYFADTVLGRVLKALEEGPHARNTIVILWSDHGWHLGEKQHWQKFTLWRACTRVPLIIQVPEGAPGLKDGTRPSVVQAPVSLVSLYPTLLELCGLPPRRENQGPSLVPLLQNSEHGWPHAALTFLAQPGGFSVSDRDWRWIHYPNGDEELYDIAHDPHEWTNLLHQASSHPQAERLKAYTPDRFQPPPPPSLASMPALEWTPLGKDPAPPSRPDGSSFDAIFINESDKIVRLHWMDREGNPRLYGSIEPGKTRRQQTRPGAVWMISDETDLPLGFFRIGDRSARGIIPKGN